MLAPWRETGRRRAAWFALILAVLAAHVLFAVRVVSSVIGWNSAAEPKHISITFARQIVPTAPPVAAAMAAPAVPAPRAMPAARAGSAPVAASAPHRAASRAVAASAPASAPSPSSSHEQLAAEALALADRLEEAQRAADAASAAAAAQARAIEMVVAAAASAASASHAAPVAGPERKPMTWPPSTRLTYTLTGMYRGGPIYGKATIEWRRAGTHYQVQFDVHVSPFFDQHMFSDGQITDRGLSPTHYDETFEVPLLAPRVRKVDFTDSDVLLANGNRAIKFPQTQDQASQFVQFVWMFATQPALLRPGTLVDFPLALTSSVHRWSYRVVGDETLAMPFGQIDTVHLTPVHDGPRRANEYPFEFWTAPTLQYLPVRVLVPIDDRNFADLSLDALPMQAAPASEEDAASQALLR